MARGGKFGLERHRAMMEKNIADMIWDISPEEAEAADVAKCTKYECYFFGCRPRLDVNYKWIWEMDLDNLCFLVNGRPEVFLFDCLPMEGYLNSDYAAELRVSKYAYVHRIFPRPSEEDPAALHNYSLFCAGTAPLHKILGVKETLTYGNTPPPLGRNTGWLEANGGASTLDAIPADTYQRLNDLICHIFRPYFYGFRYFPSSCSSISRRILPDPPPLPGCPNVYLLRHNTVLSFQNHLDNPNCLHTSSYNLFKAIMEKFTTPVPQEPFVYVVLFSGTRCAVVRVDRKEFRFTHTTSMPFFPDDRLCEPRSSAGITALARLASKIDPNCFKLEGGPPPSHGGLFEKLPPELIDMIADFCSYDFLHLRDFAGISTCTRDAALCTSVRYIFVDTFRLVKAIDETGVSPGFDKEISKYLEEKNKSFSGLFSWERAPNRRGFCIVGHGQSEPPFEFHSLMFTKEVRYGLFSLEGKEISAQEKRDLVR
ncbi:hypothetical protein L218DRAFT_1078226 [Marasmius fiardii PR-910]|nr:hypothetical protein L218DRAFT_1078226 [Marasmius fiardii PR-910]